MLGATQAAKRWARRERRKDFTIGYAQGYAEEFAVRYAESRREVIDELRVRAAGKPEILKMIDEVAASKYADPGCLEPWYARLRRLLRKSGGRS